ncbi:MAG TPA: polyprenyl synthetase family protein [Dehalococcoidia bacterium]|nr:polyprenyl synthetase family protein [Dehalococcoidia bacterium]
MQVPEALARYRRDVDAFLKSFLQRDSLVQLTRMTRYHMGWEDEQGRPADNAGKGLRPSLLLLACESVGGDWRRGIPAAAALELVHNFSLIHDDIQDRDTERHHRPTVWSIWGEAQAINAGDALLALARLALLRLHDEGLPPETTLQAARLLDERTLEMVEGQVMDLEFEQAREVSLDDYIMMIGKKTGALFDGSLAVGALVGGGDPRTAQTLGQAGRLLGMAFQVRDDMLGIWGAETRTGKRPAADIRRRKKSLPIVYALNSGDHAAVECITRAYGARDPCDEDVSMVLRSLDSINAQGYCASQAEKRKAEALDLIAALPLHEARVAEFRETAEFLLERDF